MLMDIYFEGGKQVNAVIEGFTIKTDQPVQAGGDNSAPTPFTMFLASLGTCAGIFVKGFCDQRGIDTSGIRLAMDYIYDPVQRMITKVMIEIRVPVDFPDQYDAAVIKTASLCSVKRHLHPTIEHEISVVRFPLIK